MFPFRSARRRKKANRTLLSKILVWMFGPLFLLWTIGIVITYFIAQNIANAPYDRTLADHLRLLKHEVEQQHIAQGLELSPSAHTILTGDHEHPTYWSIQDANGTWLAGSRDIPLPPDWPYDTDHVHFRNAHADGRSVRIAYLWGGKDLSGQAFLTVVSETNELRATLQQEILTGMLTPQLIVLPLAALLAGLGMTHGLEPLSLMQERLRERMPNDLSPISDELAPAEIMPLVAAMNDLLARLAASTETQRRFVANAAHQLKTPLAGIRTQAELALRAPDTDSLDASLRQLIRGSERATRLVNQLLALARAEQPERAGADSVELNELARRQTLEWVPAAMRKGLDLGFDPAPDDVSVHGDALMLAELLGNLIDNALLYTPAPGQVSVRVGSDAGAPYIEVEDSGPGIAGENRERVFDRFFRVLGSDADGSGLGLSIVKEIAEQHGARIEFLAPQRPAALPGTRLRVTFPGNEDDDPYRDDAAGLEA
ncbi:sensor histidine kinase [Candidimonas humi]|uniref:histidine kinase n=1 Tax=Candidimonas humi TaxID=683355 RepID=A0ABV8NVK3_9BURK|nr:sensor histidine kinase [Candidimonas humi]